MADLSKFFIPQYDKAGIYAIVNRTKMIAYVGQSKNIKRRAEQHKTKSANRKHDVKEINKDFDDEFSFLVLHRFYDDNVSDGKLCIFEKLYMLTMLKAGFELYNKNETCNSSGELGVAWSLCCDLMYNIGTKENLNDAYFEKYGKNYCYDLRVAKNNKH